MKLLHSLSGLTLALFTFAAASLPPDSFAADLKPHSAGGSSIRLSTVSVSTSYTMRDDDNLVLANAASAAITITLPSATNGRQITVQNTGSGSYTVTLDPPGATTINGSSTYSLTGSYQSVTLQALVNNTTTAWYVIADSNADRTQSVTATTTGATTGTILAGTSHATVTSDDANKIVILPAPVVGKQIVIHNGATGYELRTSAPASIAINGGSGSNAESAIAANSTCVLICVTTTAWKGYFLDADSDVAKIEAAAP